MKIALYKWALAIALIFLAKLGNATTSREEFFKCQGLECVVEFIEKNIRPSLQLAYKSYYDAFGSRIGSFVLQAIDSYEAKSSTELNVSPRYPAVLKKSYEKFVYSLFDFLKNVPIESINSSLQTGFDILGHSSRAVSGVEENTIELQRVQRAVDRMRPYALDPDMRSCMKGHIIDVPIENAFTTGCHIFLTQETAQNLSDDQLLAVVSHEMGHSARGDSLDNFVVLLKQAGKHTGLLLLDEASWFLTGDDYEHFKALQAGEFLDLVLRSFGVQAEKIELMADLAAVKMLLQAGQSEELLVSALIRLVAGNSDTEESNQVRKYPSLEKRIVVIREYASQLQLDIDLKR